MRRLLPTTLGVVLLLSVPVVAAPAETTVAADSKIRAVTVYPDRAQITRVAQINVTPGTYVVRFDRLPVNLQADSVRVRGEGSAQARIYGFELRNVFLGASPDKEVAALEAKLVGLEDRDRALLDERAIRDRQLTVLKQTAAQAGNSLANQLSAGKAKLQEWRDLMAFMQAQQSQETKAIQAIDLSRRTLAAQKTAIQVQLAKLKGFRQERVRQVPVTVEVTQAGTLTLSLDYVIGNARWYPTYDARLNPAGDKLNWGYYGMVSQQTGEDWNNVALKLSTAMPAAGGNPPEPPSWYLYPYRPEPAKPAGRMRDQAYAGAPPPAPAMESAAEREWDETANQQKAVNQARAVVVNQGTSVTLEAQRAMTIPSDGEEHQTPVGRANFPSKPGYVVVPKFATQAYLQVETTHAGPWPLLPGPVKAFVGQDYVGTTNLGDEVSPEQKFEMAMGTDRAIQVKRQRLSKQQGQSGVFQKVQFAEYTYEITIANQKPAAQTVTVVEPIPQSTDQDVKVTLLEANHKPLQTDQPGRVRWELKLQPHEKKVIRWGYRVEYPLGTPLAGLE
ncbi:hypothetical protein D3C72_596180 [compost metagenome]